MSKVLIIGCGGVASVAIHKCCQVPEVFTEICIASRTKAKCDKLAAELAPKTTTKITTAQVDADKVPGAGGGPLLQHHGVRGGSVRREPESPCRPAGGPAAGSGLRQPGPGL